MKLSRFCGVCVCAVLSNGNFNEREMRFASNLKHQNIEFLCKISSFWSKQRQFLSIPHNTLSEPLNLMYHTKTPFIEDHSI